MLGRHKIRREASPSATCHERDPMGSGDDGAKSGQELSVEQAVRQRHLPGSLRMHRSLERIRLHVSITTVIACLSICVFEKNASQFSERSCGEGRIPSPDNKGCMDKNECIDYPCLNGGRCINQDPRFRYRCICPDGFWGENCELVQEGQTLKLSMGALAAILVCLLIILG